MLSVPASKIPVIFCIDCEPDPRHVNRYEPEPWTGFAATHRYLSEARQRIEEATGSPARYCWFLRMDPQVAESYGSPTWALDRHPGFLPEVESHGDELGIHSHAYRWLEREQRWLLDFGNQDWVDHCVGSSLEAFSRALGRACASFRFGDRWLSTATVNLIERLGVRHDLTVEPGLRGRRGPDTGDPATGSLPGYCRVPRVPYTPSESDFRRPARDGSRKIRLIPLTSGYRVGLGLFARARRLLLNGFRYRFQDTPLHLWLRWRGPNTFDRMIDRALAVQERPYLALVARSDVGSVPKLSKGFDSSLRALLSHPARERLVFSNPAEALAMLEPEKEGAKPGA